MIPTRLQNLIDISPIIPEILAVNYVCEMLSVETVLIGRKTIPLRLFAVFEHGRNENSKCFSHGLNVEEALASS